MMRSKPFHQFLQETLSPYGFLSERHLNEAFSYAVGMQPSRLSKVSRRHHLFEIVRTPSRLAEPSRREVFPAALRQRVVCRARRVAPVFSQLAQMRFPLLGSLKFV
jgi:hypothetical protein